ncbi:MAG: response regulator [Victivallales bacterium]|nr:response regulator [Victivallales bacterium]
MGIRNILIVEDDVAFARMLQVSLENEGYNVVTAEDGVSGCNKCFQRKTDLVIMDLLLPNKDGIQAMHELKEEFSSEIVIIAISGLNSLGRGKDLLERALEHGADAVFEKPFEVKKLIETIDKINKS